MLAKRASPLYSTGKLIIDGAVLTNILTCNKGQDYWQGVQVWGTTNQHQYPETNLTYQGLLVIKNGGTIENVQHAVNNWNPNHWNEVGGVIQVTDGVFRNNRDDVGFTAYSNFSPGNPSVKRPNLSFFKNTEFVSGDAFIEKGLSVQPL